MLLNREDTVQSLDLRVVHFLQLYNAKPSQDGERYHEDLPTLEDPRDLVLSIARAKLLEILYGEKAYRTKIKISSWVVDNGCLRSSQ